MKPGVATRVAAARALGRVLDDGGHSNLVVDELRAGFGPEDAAQIQRIVLAVLRHLEGIDGVIATATKRQVATLDPEVRAVLRAGVAELLVDRGEPHGVVDSAVEATRALGRSRATGFVNAALRRVIRDDMEVGVDTMPEWIRVRLADQFGADADELLAALDRPADRGVRVRSGEPPPGMEPVPGIPGAGYVGPGWDPGSARVDFIDPASTAVVRAAAVQPGMRVLDMAAAPGGKTAALWDAMEATGLLVAADVNAARIAMARRRLSRMGIAPHWVVADGTLPPFAPETFDVVLLDAPCSGVGTLRRRPEIRHRLEPSDPGRLGELQKALVAAALPLLVPGGRLVYAVCTVFAEETTRVVAGYTARAPADVPGTPLGGGVLLAPHTTGTDGMFVSVLSR